MGIKSLRDDGPLVVQLYQRVEVGIGGSAGIFLHYSKKS